VSAEKADSKDNHAVDAAKAVIAIVNL